MNRILHAVMIGCLTFTSHANPAGCGIRPVSIRLEPEIQAQQHEPEQVGCFVAFRQALNNRSRRLLRRSQAQVIPASSTSAQVPVIVTNTSSTAPVAVPAPSNATEEKDLECAICFDMIETSEKPHTFPCGHIFHPACVAPWLIYHDTCPTCRTVDPEVETSRASRGQSLAFNRVRGSTIRIPSMPPAMDIGRGGPDW
jgi:hypothetical protein